MGESAAFGLVVPVRSWVGCQNAANEVPWLTETEEQCLATVEVGCQCCLADQARGSSRHQSLPAYILLKEHLCRSPGPLVAALGWR